ncbi:hypothetical protein AJ85_14860 [Alkalihalobacillus alcalophilus ATCC 27647 = CGMCC 1.3604]|uniref:Uncharacterized protein n=1 Tax=Alkalihalobacillus alcalophilus ATCC 27647 = CGMCC 1.3604 TaxID=1218173 RepID=A0A4S4JX87_ALKAL|nr:hypothetical protein [Alkalihalobacillus alcalophilus]MED1563069.1 hypothetical protein [Alkalihalobacillus alcalophilus]THG89856.1 hypothetical protein AJ85_14860 [Alkalihalobacillus alcalophilus ATCC 27647 = CGMCC 1.3604]
MVIGNENSDLSRLECEKVVIGKEKREWPGLGCEKQVISNEKAVLMD